MFLSRVLVKAFQKYTEINILIMQRWDIKTMSLPFMEEFSG